MHIENLEAFNFRNLERVKLELHPGTVVVEGPNAQGKTNLLEALYVCATGKSFRRARPRELLHHEADQGFVRARLVRHGVRHQVEVKLGPRSRSVRVDDRAVKRSSRLLELVNVVAFFPDDLRIVKGSPEERRNFLDRAIANHRPDFVDASSTYARAMKQRNALLRGDSVDRELLGVYDEQLVEAGVVIHRCRRETLEALAPRAQSEFSRIMKHRTGLTLRLESGLAPSGEDLEPDEFRSALESSYPRDRRRGVTSVGPHRADVVMEFDGQPARAFASQGQQRAIVLGLKLAEVHYLEERLGAPPILLLDDVSSELDTERTELLFEALRELGSQVWISTTGAAPLPVGEGALVVGVREGRLLVASSGPKAPGETLTA